ncbi:MAG: hydantoinase/oxoprolinase family protein [Gammaproteobacteria bacterium]|nr:MAG: hydantoinase/oxoprolinase family protein [Gammaproteobacteria bacterium]
MTRTCKTTGAVIGVDVGGTFTDFSVLDQESGELLNFKVPSTPGDPSEAIEAGLSRVNMFGVDGARIAHLGHGTTVATNMVIERRGSKTALLTTKGFRDILEIGRQERPHLYDFDVRKPVPLVPRYLRLEVDERVDACGNILSPLDADAVRAAAMAMLDEGVLAVAICFIHAYSFPDHELQAAAIMREILPPTVPVCLSSEILPEFREFERFSTTVMNAYLQPMMAGYMRKLVARTAKAGMQSSPYTVHSNGGLMSIEAAEKFPVQTCLSGPAAGVVGASRLVGTAGLQNVITFDVGGTSTDVSLVKDRTPAFTTDRDVAGYPIRCPMVDVHVIGAGGGSIAHVDHAGALKVGPASAGALPGPAGYGKGGLQATISDANIVLHRLNPVALLDGEMPVDENAARLVVGEVAGKLGIDIETCASGIIRIAVANMARAIRAVSVEKGHALEDFVLMAFGGAGPLHASQVAIEAGIGRVLIPNSPGTMCAQGVLMSDISRDYVHTSMQIIDKDSWANALGIRDKIIAEGLQWLATEGIAKDISAYSTTIEARYQGQNHEVPIRFDGDDMSTFIDVFTAAHRASYGYHIADRPVELVNVRVKVIGRNGQRPTSLPKIRGTVEGAVIDHRNVYLDDKNGWQKIPVYARNKLPTGQKVFGPAIIEELSSTTPILNGHYAVQDDYRNILITLDQQ